MAAGGQNLGNATLTLTLDDSDLRNKLKTLKADIEGLKVGAVKLNADGTGTRSKPTPGDRAQGGARESSNALTNAKKTRYRLDQQIQTLERAGVNTSKLRAQLGEATTAQARRQFGSFKQIAGSLQFALTKEKDRLRVQKELNAEKAKDTRVRPISFDGGARESLTAKTDAQSKRARLNQQLNSLEASGVKTTKLRAQLGEATTAQANRQFGTFNQIANSLGESLKKEREKLKIQRQQSNELKGQVTEEKRIGKLNASPVRGGVSFAGSPVALEVAARAEQRIAKANASSIRGSLGQEGSPAFNAARDKRDRESARDGRRIGSLNASPVRGGVSFPGSPVSLEVAARAEQRLAKERAAAAAATQKAADKDNANNKRIAKGNASPVGGGAAFRGSPKANAALDAEGKRVGGLNASPVRGGIAFKGSPIALEVAARAEDKLTQARQRATEAALKTAAAEAKQSAAAGKNIGRLNTSPVRGGAGFPGSPIALEKAQKEKERLAKQRKQENSARLNSGLVGGAFPLMFGQGGFAALGGAIGGTAGGGPLGFGLSLVGTLVGSQIDELSNRFNTLAKALQDPIKSLDVFIEQASLASTAQEKLAKTLIDNGQEGRAESLIAGELARTIDPAIASRVDANTDNFNRALSDTKDILGQIVAGPSSEFLNFLASILSTVNAVPSAPNPNATPEQRQKQTIDNANMAKKNASMLSAFSPGIGNILSLGISAGPDKDIRVAESKEVFALEKKLSKEKKTQQQIEEATLSAQSQGLEDTAKQLSLQAKLAGVTVKETKANKGAAEELERSKFFGFGSGDTKKAEAKRKEIKETADLERKALLAEQAGEKRSSGIKLSNAQRLSGLEGPARDIQTKKNSVSEAQREADSAQQIKNQRIKESTGSTKDKALITAASDAATTANNKLKLSKVELNETTEKAIKLAGRELDLAKSAVKGDRIGSLNKQINNVEEDRNFSLRKLGAGASLQEKEAVNLSADAKVLELQQQKKQLQNDLNQALQSELIIRQGIAKQITAAIANQGAALARADAGANPGNSVLAARAGRAEGDAFKAQNQSGINAAKDNESQLRNQLQNTVDTSKQTELVDKIRTAAEATKLAYIEAGTALAEKIGAAAATLQGAKEGMRGLLEGNINKLPGGAQIDLKREALGDVQRGVQKGILRPNINFNSTKSLLENSRFVRDVEQNQAKIAQAEAQIRALTDNTAALREGTAIAVTVNSDGAGGWTSGGAERTAA